MLRGTVFVNAVDAGHPCTIRDISKGGARLEMPDTSWMPDQFSLAIHGRGMPVDVRVAWRGDTALGVAFVHR